MKHNKFWHNKAPLPGTKRWYLSYSIGVSILASMLSSPLLGALDDDRVPMVSINYGGDYSPAYETVVTSPSHIANKFNCPNGPCTPNEIINSINGPDLSKYFEYLDNSNEPLTAILTPEGAIKVLPSRVLTNPVDYNINLTEINLGLGDPAVCEFKFINGIPRRVLVPEHQSPEGTIDLAYPLPILVAWLFRRKGNDSANKPKNNGSKTLSQKVSRNEEPDIPELPTETTITDSPNDDNVIKLVSSPSSSASRPTDRPSQPEQFADKPRGNGAGRHDQDATLKMSAMLARIKNYLLPQVDPKNTQVYYISNGMFQQQIFVNPDQIRNDKRIRLYKALGILTSTLALLGGTYAYYASEQNITNGCGIEYIKSGDSFLPNITNVPCGADGKPKEQITGLIIEFNGCENINLVDGIPNKIESAILGSKGTDIGITGPFGEVSATDILNRAIQLSIELHNKRLTQ